MEEQKPLINWAALVNMAQGGKPFIKQDSQEEWNEGAKRYIRMSKLETPFSHYQIEPMPLLETDEVLDCGCGSGRLAIPIAKKVKSVTAMDNTQVMLDACQKYAKEENLTNIDFAFLDFDTVDVEKDLKKFDVVVCSRSKGISDLKKLSSMSKRIVAIVSCSNAPNIRHILIELFKGTKQKEKNAPIPDRRIGYNIFMNQVYDLGYEPNVSIVKDGFTKTFASKDEAYEKLSKLDELDPSKMDIFKSNVDKYLTQNSDGTVTFLIETQCVVIWWDVNTKKWNDWLK